MEGQYTYSLHFRLEKDGENDYIVRSHGNYRMSRSVSADLELEPGTYSVLMKITAKKWPTDPTPEQIIRQTCNDRPEKLTQIGLAYDLAHAKGQVKETEKEKNQRQEREERKEAAAKKKRREELRAARLKQWQLEKKQRARDKRNAKRKEEHERRKAEKKKSTEPQDAFVADVTATSAVNGDVSGGDQRGKEVTTEATVEPQYTKPQPNGEAAPAPPPQDTLSKEQPTNGVSNETEITEPLPSPAAPVSRTVAGKSSEAKVTEAASTEAKTVEETKAEQFHNALQSIPSVRVNGGFVPPTSGPVPSSVVGPDDWLYDSDASFGSSIDSDLDFPPEPPSAEAVEEAAAEDDDENAEFADDPWNAVCVVGLRVYSKDSDLSIEIIRPKHDEDDGDTPLDVDDASKGASAETVGVTEGKV